MRPHTSSSWSVRTLFYYHFSFRLTVLLDDFYILKNFSDEGDFSIGSDMRISSGNQVEICGAYRNPQTSKILLDYLKSGLFSWFWRNNRACGREFCVWWVDFIKKIYYNIYRRDGKTAWAGTVKTSLGRGRWTRSLYLDPLTRSRKGDSRSKSIGAWNAPPLAFGYAGPVSSARHGCASHFLDRRKLNISRGFYHKLY